MTNTVAVRTAEWPVAPPLSNLEAYISAVQKMPMLTADEERTYASNFQASGDLQAAHRLVMSHLRLVVAISRQYHGYGLRQDDLIQEGNIGLMKAVRKFDPDQGVRLVSYAMHWIRAEINEYVLKNWRMVKMATTKTQRKLFFNLRSMKHKLRAAPGQGGDSYASLTPAEALKIADELDVKAGEVLEMEARFSGGDVSMDPGGDDDDGFGPLDFLPDETQTPERHFEATERDWLHGKGIQIALEGLDPRSKRIVNARWLEVNDDGSGGMTLHELASEYGVSAERIRQIEAAALKKMRKVIEEASRFSRRTEHDLVDA